ncbi:MAG: hypothetical protein SFU25_02795 [Candidatus Caenarcaniphilales bacterium]|nr:hypothetical protein [Candidatus Caenarcaniphilales bacterium]
MLYNGVPAPFLLEEETTLDEELIRQDDEEQEIEASIDMHEKLDRLNRLFD